MFHILLRREERSFWIVTEVPAEQDGDVSLRKVRRGLGARAPLSVFSGDQSHRERLICKDTTLFSRNSAQHIPASSVPGSSPSLQAQHPRTLSPPAGSSSLTSQLWLEHRVLGTRVLPRMAQQKSSRHRGQGWRACQRSSPPAFCSIPQAAGSSLSTRAGPLRLGWGYLGAPAKAGGTSAARSWDHILLPQPARAACRGGGFCGCEIAGKMLMHLCVWLVLPWTRRLLPSLPPPPPFSAFRHSLPFISTSLELPGQGSSGRTAELRRGGASTRPARLGEAATSTWETGELLLQ